MERTLGDEKLQQPGKRPSAVSAHRPTAGRRALAKKSPYPKTHNPNYIDALKTLTLKMLSGKSEPILPFINVENVKALAITMTRDTDIPWFGQLMNAPQLLAYLLQIDFWMREYKVEIV